MISARICGRLFLLQSKSNIPVFDYCREKSWVIKIGISQTSFTFAVCMFEDGGANG